MKMLMRFIYKDFYKVWNGVSKIKKWFGGW